LPPLINILSRPALLGLVRRHKWWVPDSGNLIADGPMDLDEDLIPS